MQSLKEFLEKISEELVDFLNNYTEFEDLYIITSLNIPEEVNEIKGGSIYISFYLIESNKSGIYTFLPNPNNNTPLLITKSEKQDERKFLYEATANTIRMIEKYKLKYKDRLYNLIIGVKIFDGRRKVLKILKSVDLVHLTNIYNLI